MMDCVVRVPVFLVLSNQVVMDSGATSCLPDEESCTSRVTPEAFLGKGQWSYGCWGVRRRSSALFLGLLDPMSSPIKGVALGLCALDTRRALWATRIAKCPSHRVDHWVLRCRSPARMALVRQTQQNSALGLPTRNALTEVLLSHS